MNVALLSIGTELLEGEIADTNGQWLAEHLTGLGFRVTSIETVADEREALAAAMTRRVEQFPLWLATGGLGPTSDDITAEVAASVFGLETELNDDAMAAIRRRVEQLGSELRAGHEKQARLPVSAELLPNSVGTAPGFILRNGSSTGYFLPGVPEEMKRMYRQQVEPRIRSAVACNSYQIVLHTYGLGESSLSEQLAPVEREQAGVVFGYVARSQGVAVKITARGTDPAQAREQAEVAASAARKRLGAAVYAEGDETIVQLASRAVRSRGWRLAVAESCTGGLIARMLTAVPASDYFVGGAVTYANAAKTKLLGVSEDTLRGHGAVSAEVAAEMAEGARRAFQCEVAVSVTGIAGPTGASGDKPLGQCHFAVACPAGTVVEQRVFRGNRDQIQQQAAHAALDLLRRTCSLNGEAARRSRPGV